MKEKEKFGYRAGRITRAIETYGGFEFPPGSTSIQEIKTSFQSNRKGVFFYSSSQLRKIIRFHRSAKGFLFQVPHTMEYTLLKSDFQSTLVTYLPHLARDIHWDEIQSSYITLLSLPTRKERKSHSIEYFAFHYWSYLFHSFIHQEFHKKGQKLQDNLLNLLSQIHEIGTHT
ncbi:MAG: hypothetical protein D6785_11335, partial [Planctomycetota bacterium]